MDNANMPSKFRPKSPCQSFYKVVAKVLINHLKPVLGYIISEEKGAFVSGRSISSHGLMAQDMMTKFKGSTQKSGLIAIKVDIEQEYDYMSWDTLYKMLPEEMLVGLGACLRSSVAGWTRGSIMGRRQSSLIKMSQQEE
ncbi:uncharacterized protein LOC114579864 [Dendrobium catenatum]|uniref:uncharacterized protein LOC114579864 n=1 Tax=Dendrobium catenatum TaxID=906689 RepID=UPI00109FB84A|nr:uncharacterized protein LOC114579864 [Dendrobium catenatum]